jgi:hypothetical protein
MEHLVLANAIASRKAFDAVMTTGHQEQLRDTGKALWSVIEDWYDRDRDVMSINVELLKQRLEQVYPQHSGEFVQLVDSLDGYAAPENFTEILLESRRAVLREQMTIRLMENKEDEFRDLLGQYNTLGTDTDEGQKSFVGADISGLLEVVEEGNRIPLAPSGLNEVIRGGMLPGHHATVFGRPEAGKSLFAINSLVSAAAAGYRCGFWENEDPIVTTQLRTAQCITNTTEAELRAGGSKVQARLDAGGWYDRIHFRDSPAGTLYEIGKWVDDLGLDFLVVNQLAGVRVRGDNRVLELETIAKGLREIAKSRQCAVLSVTQAGDSGDNKRILQMGDIDWSNTAIQAACDLLVGFGVDDELKIMHNRVLSLCKNKLGNKHDALMIRVDEERNVID